MGEGCVGSWLVVILRDWFPVLWEGSRVPGKNGLGKAAQQKNCVFRAFPGLFGTWEYDFRDQHHEIFLLRDFGGKRYRGESFPGDHFFVNFLDHQNDQNLGPQN